MKKILLVVVAFVLISAGYEFADYVGPMTEAFAAFQEQGEELYRSGGLNSRGFVKGPIIRISYQFVSSKRLTSERVSFVARQSVQYQRSGEAGIGSREVAQTKQRAILHKTAGVWRIETMEEERTEIVRLDDSELIEPRLSEKPVLP